jgi:DASH complex subunit ASK1
MEQIDQLNVFLLQDIDEKFSNFHQVITTRLIPAVKKFNAVSEPTREAAKVRICFTLQGPDRGSVDLGLRA